MSAEAASPITTYFRVCDGVRVRFADNKADSDVTVLLMAPWPESLWAFRRIWHRVSAIGRAVAIDLPGFGHSDGRPELIAPIASGVFLARLIDEWQLGAPHIVGPDIGTAAALFLAAKAPERVTSLTVGGGAVRFPIEAGGALKDIIEAPSLDVVRGLDARNNIDYAVEPGASRESEPEVHEDYVSAYDLGRFADPPDSCGSIRSRAPCCAISCRRSRRRPRSWRGATMTSCRGRTTSTSTTSSRTARSMHSTPVTSRGSRRRRNTGASWSIGCAVDTGASQEDEPTSQDAAFRRLIACRTDCVVVVRRLALLIRWLELPPGA